jgi:uncharacterized BrkB/YihY/UPF0761 family membrane protein
VTTDGTDASQDDAAELLDIPAGRLARLQATATERTKSATAWAAETRERNPVVDAGFLIYERDRVSAGSVLGSAIAFRLFLFFVPFMLFGIGLVGLVSGHVDADSISRAGSIRGQLAEQLRSAQDQSTTAKLLTVATGLFLMVSAGRSLAKALVASSSLAWSARGNVTAKVRALAAIVGVVSSLILVSFAINRVRDEAGTAAASLSFGAGFVVYLVLIVLLMSTLPRGTSDPGAILPGAALVAIVIAGMQAFSQLYIPGKVADASDLYGGVGVAVVALGWLFIFGRSLSFAFSVNAALFERFGSLSRPIFALPVLRLLPRHSRRLREYFALADEPGQSTDGHERVPESAE